MLLAISQQALISLHTEQHRQHMTDAAAKYSSHLIGWFLTNSFLVQILTLTQFLASWPSFGGAKPGGGSVEILIQKVLIRVVQEQIFEASEVELRQRVWAF